MTNFVAKTEEVDAGGQGGKMLYAGFAGGSLDDRTRIGSVQAAFPTCVNLSSTYLRSVAKSRNMAARGRAPYVRIVRGTVLSPSEDEDIQMH